MTTYADNYNQYLEALDQLLLLPEQEEEALRQAQRVGDTELLQADQDKRKVEENWNRIDRLHRELDVKLQRLATSFGVKLEQLPAEVPMSSSNEILLALRQMSQELDALSSSWNWMKGLERHHDTPQMDAPPKPPSQQTTPSRRETSAPTKKREQSTSPMPIVSIGIATLIIIIILYISLG